LSKSQKAGAPGRPPFEVRPSKIAGLGAFAVRPLRKGTRIIEYLGERISPDEADRRYEDDSSREALVLLFSVDARTVIDAGIDGNEARFINHSCEPNCKAVTRSGRVHIWSLRDLQKGEELTYDYNLTREGLQDAAAEERYKCRCGAPTCRGTMLAPK
jgi:SET domain-containing protein